MSLIIAKGRYQVPPSPLITFRIKRNHNYDPVPVDLEKRATRHSFGLSDKNSQNPDDFMINIADLLDAKVEGKKMRTEQQIREEYSITDNELTKMQSIAFQILPQRAALANTAVINTQYPLTGQWSAWQNASKDG